MKKLIVMLLMVVLFAGCESQPLCENVTVSVWDDRDDAIGVRVGYDMNDVEIGLSVLHWPEIDNSEVFGAYGLYKFPDMVEIPNPINADFLPDVLMGTPYIGGKMDSQGGETLLMAGIEIQNILFLEYQDNLILAGLKHKF